MYVAFFNYHGAQLLWCSLYALLQVMMINDGLRDVHYDGIKRMM